MAFDAFDPYEQQDEFSSSFFQQPQQPYAAPEPEPARARWVDDSAPQPPGDLTSSVLRADSSAAPPGVFGRENGGVVAPGVGAELARRHAPADYGATSQSSPSGATSPAGGFDYGSLVSQVKTSQDPRQRAIAQDQLARATYSQLKNAGHEVNWDGDNLVVDGRPYVIGDGSSAPPAPAAAPPTSAKTPTTSPYQSAADLANAPGGRTQGGAANPQDAYDRLSARLDPNASREEMEAAIEEEFGHLPGYGGAYKESVMLNGRWYDMVTGYGGAGASWGGLTPKGPSSSAMGTGMFGSSSLMSSALSPFGGTGGAGGGNRGVEGARGVELSAGLNPAILAYLQQQQPEEPDPMQASYMNLLR